MKKIIKFKHDKFAGIKLEGLEVKNEPLAMEFLHHNIGWSDNTSFMKQLWIAPEIALLCDQRGLEKRMPRTLVINQQLPFSQLETIAVYGDCIICFFNGIAYYGFNEQQFNELYPLFEAMKQ